MREPVLFKKVFRVPLNIMEVTFPLCQVVVPVEGHCQLRGLHRLTLESDNSMKLLPNDVERVGSRNRETLVLKLR